MALRGLAVASKQTVLPAILAALLLVLALTAYFAPLSERALTVTTTLTTPVTETQTLITTIHSASLVRETSTLTITATTESLETIIDKGYRVLPTGSEFSYQRISGLKKGDRIKVSVTYPYKTWVKLVDPQGKNIIDTYFDKELAELVEVEHDGVHTLWVEPFFSPGIEILRVKVEIARTASVTQITETILERQLEARETRTSLAKSTQTRTEISKYFTYEKAPLASRNMLITVLIILAIITLLVGLALGKVRKPKRVVYCVNCGASLSPQDRFCPECGASQKT
ncbi:MAG: zinc ribbon domain-containing protein [Candidatus Bathyarchaeia archaeon]